MSCLKNKKKNITRGFFIFTVGQLVPTNNNSVDKFNRVSVTEPLENEL